MRTAVPVNLFLTFYRLKINTKRQIAGLYRTMLYVRSKTLSITVLLTLVTACNSSGGGDSSGSLSGSVQARAFIVSTATCDFTGKEDDGTIQYGYDIVKIIEQELLD